MIGKPPCPECGRRHAEDVACDAKIRADYLALKLHSELRPNGKSPCRFEENLTRWLAEDQQARLRIEFLRHVAGPDQGPA